METKQTKSNASGFIIAIVSIVFLSIIISIYLVKGWFYLHNEFWWMVLAGLIGFFVGLSELLNRYKSFRFIFINGYSWMYMLINTFAAILAFIIIKIYNLNLGDIGSHALGKAFIAGLGSMAFLRSSFFSFKVSTDKSIAIGPAALLSIFLQASERQFDQLVGQKILKEIGEIMKGLNFISASKDLPIIVLRSMVVLSDDEQKKLSEDIGKLLNDESTNNEIRIVTLGIIISRLSGIKLLKEAVALLRENYNSVKQVEVELKSIPTIKNL